jgi:enamidase
LIDIGRFAALRRVRLWYDPGRRHCADIEERRMKTAIVNIGQIVSGDWKSPFQSGDAILCEDGLIQSVGTLSAQDVVSADVVIDAGGATAIPGLIDSHVQITFGD